jgi:hypothetical protein
LSRSFRRLAHGKPPTAITNFFQSGLRYQTSGPFAPPMMMSGLPSPSRSPTILIQGFWGGLSSMTTRWNRSEDGSPPRTNPAQQHSGIKSKFFIAVFLSGWQWDDIRR